MPKKRWDAEFKGMRVRFVNQWSFSGYCKEELYVNDELMSSAEVTAHSSRISDIVFGRHVVDYRHDDHDYKIDVRVGSKWPGIFLGCHIYIDGQLVGGDVRSRLMFSRKTIRNSDPQP